VTEHPECQFHFVMGNHDHHDEFEVELCRLADSRENLDWHPFYLRRGNAVFLHGDVADGNFRDQERLLRSRRRWAKSTTKKPWQHSLYDLAINARLHKAAASVVYHRRRVTRRILKYLDHIDHGPESGVEHVYFGHTHVAMNGYRRGGVRFHNGGAPLSGVEFRVVEAAIEEPVE